MKHIQESSPLHSTQLARPACDRASAVKARKDSNLENILNHLVIQQIDHLVNESLTNLSTFNNSTFIMELL